MSGCVFDAYGLTFASELDCPHLARSSLPPNVSVRFGSVPVHLDHPTLSGESIEAAHGRFLIRAHGVARYLVRGGCEVTIDPAASATEHDVREHLLTTVLWVLLSMRGDLSLHAAAIATRNGAVLFAGRSGHGKSTLLAALVARGHRMFSDDLTAIRPSGCGNPLVVPGVPDIRLWADAAARLGRSTTGLASVRPELQKCIVPMTSALVDQPQPLHAICVLRVDEAAGIRIEPQVGAARFAALREHVVAGRRTNGLPNRPESFRRTAEIAGRVPVFAVTRPRAPYLLEELADRIEHEVARC